jgi:hypothetical protein
MIMTTNEQKIRECAATLVGDGCIYDDVEISEVVEILTRYFGQTEQSFEYCDCSKPSHYKGEMPNCIHSKQPDKSLDECEWKRDEHHDAWDTSCGEKYQFMNPESPSENGFNFCHHCGKKMVEASQRKESK